MRERKFDGCTWGIRTIRKDGVVLFKGRLWKINGRHMAYDGRLDGKRAIVAEYTQYERVTGRPMMALHSCPPMAWPGDQCVDGVFVWDGFDLMEIKDG